MNSTVLPSTTRGGCNHPAPFSPSGGMRPSGKGTTSQQEFPGSRMPSSFKFHKSKGRQGPTPGQKPRHSTHRLSRPRPKRLRAPNVCASRGPSAMPSHHKDSVEEPVAFGLCYVAGCAGRACGRSGSLWRKLFALFIQAEPGPSHPWAQLRF